MNKRSGVVAYGDADKLVRRKPTCSTFRPRRRSTSFGWMTGGLGHRSQGHVVRGSPLYKTLPELGIRIRHQCQYSCQRGQSSRLCCQRLGRVDRQAGVHVEAENPVRVNVAVDGVSQRFEANWAIGRQPQSYVRDAEFAFYVGTRTR
jgi:hypothetical protein